MDALSDTVIDKCLLSSLFPGLLASRMGGICHWETRPLSSCYNLCLSDFCITSYWKLCYGLVMIEHTLQKSEDVLWQLGHSSLHALKTRFFWDLYALSQSFNCFYIALEILISVNDDFMIWFSLVPSSAEYMSCHGVCLPGGSLGMCGICISLSSIHFSFFPCSSISFWLHDTEIHVPARDRA